MSDIQLGGGYLPEQVPAATRERITALVVEHSRREDLSLWKRIELLDQAIWEELTLNNIEEQFREDISVVSTHGLNINYDLTVEELDGETDIWLHVWDYRGREYSYSETFATVGEAVESLAAEYRDYVELLASQECTDVYGEIVGGPHVIDVADYSEFDTWEAIVAAEILDRVDGDDRWDASDNARALGYWQVAAAVEIALRREAL